MTNAAVLSEKKPPLGGTGNVNGADLALYATVNKHQKVVQ